jgi:tetratricopeptide (TPR) repeat protein
MKYGLGFIFLMISFLGQAQEENENAILKELGDNACLCIDSINLYDKAKNEVIDEISSCIGEQTGVYQIMSQLKKAIPEQALIDSSTATKNDTINIAVDFNEDSQNYKDAYYELERYLMNNCEKLNLAINSNEKQSENSMSKDTEALRYYELGYAEAKEENCERAIEYYREAVRIDPDFAFAWDNIGICYRRLENYDKAIEAYENSLKIDPYGMMPLQNIAIAYQYKKEFKKAIQAYEQLGKIHPGNPEVYYGIAHVYAYNLDDYEKALHNACKAYVVYVEQKSPYRSDAEQMINFIFSNMQKQGKEDKFYKILEKYEIHTAE